MVQFFHHGQLVKTHPRKDRGKQTDLGDYPPEKIAFHMRTPTWCRRRAADVGPAAVVVIDELLADNALFRLRAAQGVIGLADKHNPARLEAACGRPPRRGTRPTAPSMASSPPAPKPPLRPGRAVTPGRPRTCTDPRSCSPTPTRPAPMPSPLPARPSSRCPSPP